jgi:hypothetical protein
MESNRFLLVATAAAAAAAAAFQSADEPMHRRVERKRAREREREGGRGGENRRVHPSELGLVRLLATRFRTRIQEFPALPCVSLFSFASL